MAQQLDRIQDRDARAAEAVIQNPLMREEVRRANDQAQNADTYRNISGYLNWVTTGLVGLSIAFAGIVTGIISTELIAGVAAEQATGFLATLVAGGPAAWGIVAAVGAASLVALTANIMISRQATKIEKYNEVLSSDIDSQNQAHRMVQAFAKAQTQGHVQADDSSPMTSTAPSWAERTGGARQQHGSWQERVVADAAREEVQNMAAVRGA